MTSLKKGIGGCGETKWDLESRGYGKNRTSIEEREASDVLILVREHGSERVVLGLKFLLCLGLVSYWCIYSKE